MDYFIEGKKFKWEVVLGLEVHAQISSKSKLFSEGSTEWGGNPNSQVDLVDCGMPGALPVINEYCVDQAIITGLSLNAKINEWLSPKVKNIDGHWERPKDLALPTIRNGLKSG